MTHWVGSYWGRSGHAYHCMRSITHPVREVTLSSSRYACSYLIADACMSISRIQWGVACRQCGTSNSYYCTSSMWCRPHTAGTRIQGTESLFVGTLVGSQRSNWSWLVSSDTGPASGSLKGCVLGLQPGAGHYWQVLIVVGAHRAAKLTRIQTCT